MSRPGWLWVRAEEPAGVAAERQPFSRLFAAAAARAPGAAQPAAACGNALVRLLCSMGHGDTRSHREQLRPAGGQREEDGRTDDQEVGRQ